MEIFLMFDEESTKKLNAFLIAIRDGTKEVKEVTTYGKRAVVVNWKYDETDPDETPSDEKSWVTMEANPTF